MKFSGALWETLNSGGTWKRSFWGGQGIWVEGTDVWGSQSGGHLTVHMRVVGFGLRTESWGRKKGAESSGYWGRSSRICPRGHRRAREEAGMRLGLGRGTRDGERPASERVSIPRSRLEQQLFHQGHPLRPSAGTIPCADEPGFLLISPLRHSSDQQTLAEYVLRPECNDSLKPSGETEMQIRTPS